MDMRYEEASQNNLKCKHDVKICFHFDYDLQASPDNKCVGDIRTRVRGVAIVWIGFKNKSRSRK
jgi:hypothetical protein